MFILLRVTLKSKANLYCGTNYFKKPQFSNLNIQTTSNAVFSKKYIRWYLSKTLTFSSSSTTMGRWHPVKMSVTFYYLLYECVCVCVRVFVDVRHRCAESILETNSFRIPWKEKHAVRVPKGVENNSTSSTNVCD